MQRLLLPLLAALALPTAASAETVWLILRYSTGLNQNGVGAALEKIQMNDLQECEMVGAQWMGSKPSRYERAPVFGFNCFKGKKFSVFLNTL